MLLRADSLQLCKPRFNRNRFKDLLTGKLLLCLAGYLLVAVLPAHAQGLTSLLVTGGDHAYFVDANQHVNQMYFTGSGWTFQDITLAANAPLAAAQSEVTSLLVGGGDHVYFFDLHWHVAQMYPSSNGWIYQDLTALSGMPDAPVTGSSITSALLGGADYVFYQGSDNHVKQLWWTGQRWAGADLSPMTQPVILPSRGSKFSLVSEGGRLHLYYTGSDQHVDQLFWTGSAWVCQDLTVAADQTAAVKATNNSSLSSVFANNLSYVYYFSPSMHIMQLAWDGSHWHNFDLTFASSAKVVAAANSGLTSFNFTNGMQFVCYVDPNKHVDQLWWNTQSWINQDLTGFSGASTQASPQADMASLVIGGGGHIYYTDTTGHINQLYYDNNVKNWVNQDLTALSSGRPNNNGGHSLCREYIHLGSSLIAIENVQY